MDAGATVKWKHLPQCARSSLTDPLRSARSCALQRGSLRLRYVCDEVVVTAIEVLREFAGANPDEARRNSI